MLNTIESPAAIPKVSSIPLPPATKPKDDPNKVNPAPANNELIAAFEKNARLLT